MTSEYYLELAVRLCCADLNSEFISLQPVLGTRDELLDQRLTWYCEQLERIDTGLKQGNKGSSTLFALAVEFTCADIESGAIAVAPVLYDRDEKIGERLLAHLTRLCGRVADDDVAVPEVLAPEPEVFVPVQDNPPAERVNPVVPVRKGKKKKKRR